MKEYLKKFIFFLILSIVFGIVLHIALPKTMDVRIIGNVSTITDVSWGVNANVSGLMDTKTKLRF
jgi:hypothetical protein